jgi:hypothetical protein
MVSVERGATVTGLRPLRAVSSATSPRRSWRAASRPQDVAEELDPASEVVDPDALVDAVDAGDLPPRQPPRAEVVDVARQAAKWRESVAAGRVGR